jgi:L-alanine-DL-glutamate epimerase-like enolase superfamily enzyme
MGIPGAELLLQVEPSHIPLQTPLRLATATVSVAHTVVARLSSSGAIGYGEAAPIARYGDSVEEIVAFYQAFSLPADATAFSRERVVAPVPRAARCALDIAFHDLVGRLHGISIGEYLGLGGLERPLTSQTISIGEPNAVLARVAELRDAPILKIKLGGGDDTATIELIESIRSAYTGAIRIDINEGWTPEQTVAILNEIARFEIEFCEQPIPAGSPERIHWISEHAKVPVMIDEDALEASDLARFAGGAAYAVNVKLAKCGGIAAACAMIATARALGLRVMLGCMAETRILATAAAHLAPLADWLDIDGPLLLARDPYDGVEYENGRVVVPSGPGLGVERRVEYAA